MKNPFKREEPTTAEQEDLYLAIADRLKAHDAAVAVAPTEPPVTRQPEPVPATKGLATNLQRAVDLYEQRANQLQCTIDAATSERSDVIKARDAAKLALEALVTDVMEAAVAADLAEGVE